MCRIRQALTATEGLSLVNSMITGTQAQEKLVQFKTKNNYGVTDDYNCVGVGYWHGFMRRNGDKICRKRGQKYELDRATWTTYANFDAMYEHNYEELVEAGVASLMDTPEWQDKEGNTVEGADSFGCKVTHQLTHPDYCIVLDEVGGNIHMTGDGDIGGEQYLCEKGTVPQMKTSKGDKHFTLLGLTLLSGDALMCVVIFSGKRRNTMVETGIDMFAEEFGEVSDKDYILKNSGKNKRFPGGPTCTHRGIDIPCLCEWTENGSITSDILRKVLNVLDELLVFDRTTGITPVVLLDGHGSRVQLPFLQYINNPEHLWAVIIGVPYGTSLWQVGDSKEQNGSYKMALSRFKKKLIQRKEKYMLDRLTIETTDIMLMINYAWDLSFKRVEPNKIAISERGWGPLNRNLMLDKQLRSTMTAAEKGKEKEPDSGITIPYHQRQNYIVIDDSAPTLDTKFITPLPPPIIDKPNLSNGMAAWCVDAIVQNQDLMEARGRIKKNQENGKSKSQKLMEIKKMTAAAAFLTGTTRLGEGVFQRVKRGIDEADAKQAEAKRSADLTHRAALLEYDAVMALQKPPTSWNVAQLKSVLKVLKRKEDGAMPSKKADLVVKYNEWSGRTVHRGDGDDTPATEVGATDTVAQENNNMDDDDECIHAMMMLNPTAFKGEVEEI